MDEIENAINQLENLLNESTPKIKIPLFPSYVSINEISSLCLNNQQKNNLLKWLNKQEIKEEKNLIFETIFNYKQRKIIINKIIVSLFILSLFLSLYFLRSQISSFSSLLLLLLIF